MSPVLAWIRRRLADDGAGYQRRTGATIIGEHDAPNARDLGVYEVYPYDTSLRSKFHELLTEIDPDEIVVNYAEDDTIADGLTHGMYRRLVDLLAGTGYEGRLESADEVVTRLRSDKSPIERERMVRAAELTRTLLQEVTSEWSLVDRSGHRRFAPPANARPEPRKRVVVGILSDGPRRG